MDMSEVDWRYISNSVRRRKLQNRVNQRASRQRRAQAVRDTGELVVKQWSVTVNNTTKPSDASICAVRHDKGSYDAGLYTVVSPFDVENKHHGDLSNDLETFGSDGSAMGSHNPSPNLEQEVTDFWPAQYKHSYLPSTGRRPSPSADYRLLTLIYYNVFRGFHWNISILGLDPNQMYLDEYPSPFVPLSPTATSRITKLPPALRPTALQKNVAHHPFIDIFPCSVMRDNVLRRGLTDQEEDELCHDLLGLSEDRSEWLMLHADEGPRTGVTLWGDPWDINNWEISEYMALKWNWLFTGATELMESTNIRRRARGWKEIRLA